MGTDKHRERINTEVRGQRTIDHRYLILVKGKISATLEL